MMAENCPFEALSASSNVVRSLAGDPARLRSYLKSLYRASAQYYHTDTNPLISVQESQLFFGAYSGIDSISDDALSELAKAFLGREQTGSYALRLKLIALMRDLKNAKDECETERRGHRQSVIEAQEAQFKMEATYLRVMSMFFTGVLESENPGSIRSFRGYCFFNEPHYSLWNSRRNGQQAIVRKRTIALSVIAPDNHLLRRQILLEFGEDEKMSVTESNLALKHQINKELEMAESGLFSSDWENLGLILGTIEDEKYYLKEALPLSVKQVKERIERICDPSIPTLCRENNKQTSFTFMCVKMFEGESPYFSFSTSVVSRTYHLPIRISDRLPIPNKERK